MTKKDKIREEYYKDPDFSRSKLAKELDVDEAYIRSTIRPLKKNTIKQGHKPLEEKMEFNRTSQNRATLDLESLTITTLEQALEVANVDMTQWKVDRYTVGSWQVTLKIKKPTGETDKKGHTIYINEPKTVTMYKIQVWLVKLHNMEWVEAIRNLIEEVPKLKTPKYKRPALSEEDMGRYLLEVALFDVHFGMLAWGKETTNDYDLKIAEDLFLYAVQDLLKKSMGYQPARIIFPFGNDFLHIDDPTNLTPMNRNPLDVDSRLIKIYQKAKKAVIKAIDYCRQVAPVDVVWIPGNHDPNVSFYLCDVISEVFANDEDVKVDVGPKWRKFYPWGKGLICYTHGVEEPLRDLPSIIATEEPQLWANAKYREIHIGHKHRKQEMKWTNVDTHQGTVLRMIPSLATEDAWHYRKGYIKGYHAAESYLWDYDCGVVGQFTSYIDYDKQVKGKY